LISRVRVTEEHHIALARQVVRQMAEEIGFSSRDTCMIVTSVSELASNLYFHATGGGSLLFRRIDGDGAPGIEVVSDDDGPGIADVDLAMRDGYSTSGGLGSGLPGVSRLMDEFRITSRLGSGTRVWGMKWKSGRT
jgi:serine/threonine-protein kinase RsbT